MHTKDPADELGRPWSGPRPSRGAPPSARVPYGSPVTTIVGQTLLTPARARRLTSLSGRRPSSRSSAYRRPFRNGMMASRARMDEHRQLLAQGLLMRVRLVSPDADCTLAGRSRA